jgi:hypothetical protein
MTSPIHPVYLITGIFADLLYSPYGPGGFDTSDERPKMRYWGNGDTDKHPWTTQEDAVSWTIDVLRYGDGVQARKGGIFKIPSGVTTVKELAAVYEKVHGTKVDVTRGSSLEDLDAELAKLRKEKGRAQGYLYMSEAAAVIASKGLWEMKGVTVLDRSRKPTILRSTSGRRKIWFRSR